MEMMPVRKGRQSTRPGNLLSILQKLCAPGLGEDDYETTQWEDIPKNWLLYFNEAIHMLNNRLIPSLQCLPAKLIVTICYNSHRLFSFLPTLAPL